MTDYKCFEFENRSSSSRDVTLSVTIPFHSGELPRSTQGNPIQALQDGYSVRVNGVDYNTTWVEFGAPFYPDENGDGGFVRFARADWEMSSLASGRYEGEIVRRSNSPSAFNWSPTMQAEVGDMVWEAIYSGAFIQDATANLSGSSSGVYTGNMLPVSPVGNPSNLVYIEDEGLRRIVKSEVWLGEEHHYIDQVIPVENGESRSGFVRAELIVTFYSNRDYFDYTIGFWNDKLNNPIWQNPGGQWPGQNHSIYHAGHSSGQFFVNFTGSNYADYHVTPFMENPFNINTGVLPSTDKLWELPLAWIADSQGWAFRGAGSVASKTESNDHAIRAIHCFPTWDTWSGVNGPEYPWPENKPSTSFINSTVNTANGRYDSFVVNTSQDTWSSFGQQKNKGSSGFQGRFGRVPRAVQPFLYGFSPKSLDRLWAGELRNQSATLGHYRGLIVPDPIELPRIQRRPAWGEDNHPFYWSVFTYEQVPNHVHFHYTVHFSSVNQLGRYANRNTNAPAVRDRGLLRAREWTGYRTQHAGVSLSFYGALITHDRWLKEAVRYHSLAMQCAVPKLNAMANGVPYAPAGFGCHRCMSRTLRAWLQDYYLNGNIDSRRHGERHLLDVAFGSTSDTTPLGQREVGLTNPNNPPFTTYDEAFLLWQSDPGARSTSRRRLDGTFRRLPRDPNGEEHILGYHESDASETERCNYGFTGTNPNIPGSYPSWRTSYNCAPSFNQQGQRTDSRLTYPAANTVTDWVKAPWNGTREDGGFNNAQWQAGQHAAQLALWYLEFGNSGALQMGQDIIHDFAMYSVVVPPEPWVIDFNNATGDQQPRMTKNMATQDGRQNQFGGPHFGGDPVNFPQRDNAGLNTWAYPGLKAFSVFLNPEEDPILYQRASRAYRGMEFSLEFDKEASWNNGNLTPQRQGHEFYVGQWNWSPQGSGPGSFGVIDAAFSAAPLRGFAPLTVQFTDETTGNITSWAWDFDNNGTVDSTDQNPLHTYTRGGLYSVGLRVGNAGGGGEIIRQSYIEVIEGQPPIPDFEVNVSRGTAPLTVTFTSLSTRDPEEYLWNVDNVPGGETSPVWRSDTRTFTYTYTDPGVYSVRHGVRNQFGARYINRENLITVNDPNIPARPVASFIASPTEGVLGFSVQFTDLSTPSNTITSRSWDFGNGVSSSLKNPVYVYPGTGVFTVGLTVTSPGGSSTTSRKNYITVLDPVIDRPIPVLTSTDPNGYAPHLVFFQDETSGSITGRSWSLTGSQIIDTTEDNPVVLYTDNFQQDIVLQPYTSTGVWATGVFSGYIETESTENFSPDTSHDITVSRVGSMFIGPSKKRIKIGNKFTLFRGHMLESSASSVFSGDFRVATATDTTTYPRRHGIIEVDDIANFQAPLFVDKAKLQMRITAYSGSANTALPNIDIYRLPWDVAGEPSWTFKDGTTHLWQSPGANYSGQDYDADRVARIVPPRRLLNTVFRSGEGFIDLDITDYWKRRAYEAEGCLLFKSEQPKGYSGYSDIQFDPRMAMSVRYNNMPSFSTTGYATLLRQDDLTYTGRHLVECFGYEGFDGQSKTFVKFNLSGMLPSNTEVRSWEPRQVIAAFGIVEQSSDVAPPRLYHVFDGFSDDVSWTVRDPNDGDYTNWYSSGASGSLDRNPTGIAPIYTSRVTGEYYSEYNGSGFRSDTYLYDVTAAFKWHAFNKTHAELGFILQFPVETEGADTLGFSGTSKNSRYGPRLYFHGIQKSIQGSGSAGVTGGGSTGFSGGGISGDISGSSSDSVVFFRGNQNNGFTTTQFWSGTAENPYLELTGNAQGRQNKYYYEKIFMYNDSNVGWVNSEVRLYAEKPWQFALANEKQIGDNNSGDPYSMPNGYLSSDFTRMDIPNNSLNLGPIDISGFTGFWVRWHIPAGVKSDDNGWVYPVASYEVR